MTKRPLPEDRKEESRKLKEIFNLKKRELDLTQEKIANLMNINQSSVSHYLNGINPLNTTVATVFAYLLKVEVADFSPRLAAKIEDMVTLSSKKHEAWNSKQIDEISNVEPALHPTRHFDYPEISWVQAGAASEAMDLGNIATCPTHASDVWAGHEGFWLKVVGSSMTSPVAPSFPEGVLILVAPDIEPRSGQFVVARLIDSNEATFKQLIKDAGETFLKPLNPAYPITPMQQNWEIVGTVVDGKMPKSIFF